MRASLASCSAAATAKPFGARTEARSGVPLPSSCATSAGRPVSSLSRPAINPMSPTDHGPRTATSPSPRKARASSRVDPTASPRSARASSIATFVNSLRSRLIPSRSVASSAASAGSSVVSSASAGAASPMRPAALMRGEIVKPETSARYGGSAPAARRSAAIPTGIVPAPFITFSADRTMTRNSFATGTMSAIPPTMASTESSAKSSRRCG